HFPETQITQFPLPQRHNSQTHRRRSSSLPLRSSSSSPRLLFSTSRPDFRLPIRRVTGDGRPATTKILSRVSASIPDAPSPCSSLCLNVENYCCKVIQEHIAANLMP
ncbi:unnamed protein product, partial [Linum tenue]